MGVPLRKYNCSNRSLDSRIRSREQLNALDNTEWVGLWREDTSRGRPGPFHFPLTVFRKPTVGSTFFSFSRRCWSLDLIWRSWNFKSFPISGKLNFSPLSIIAFAANNTCEETQLLGKVAFLPLAQSGGDEKMKWYFGFVIFVLLQRCLIVGQKN